MTLFCPYKAKLQKAIHFAKKKALNINNRRPSISNEKPLWPGNKLTNYCEKGLSLLKHSGLLSFITSNGWMKSGYGAPLRNLLSQQFQPKCIIDFAGYKVFEAATVDVNILFIENRTPYKKTIACTIDKSDFRLNKLSDFVETHSALSDFSSSEEPSVAWSILSELEKDIKQKIESIGTPLRQWDIRINFGIKTGYNDAFIISGDTREKILSTCLSATEREKTAEIIRPILRGRDINRYGYVFADQYLIATFPAKNYDIDDYPALKNYLLTIGIERLEQTGEEHIVNGERIKARKKTNNKWFETQDSISYWDDLSRPKIIWGEISDKSKFCLDEKGEYYPEATTFMLSGDNLYYLLAFLNCSVSEYVFSTIGTTTGVGTVRWKKYKILELAVPDHLAPAQVEQISNLCKEVVRLKRTASSRFADEERNLNYAIYSVYGLTAPEIEYIERQIS